MKNNFLKKMVYPCTSNQASNNNNDPVNSFRRIFKSIVFQGFYGINRNS